jgi:acyl-CoA dehydrogenase-like protein
VVHTHAVGHALVAVGRHDDARRVAGGEVWVLAWGSTVEGQLRLPRVDLGLQPDQVVAVDAEGAMVVWPATGLPAGPVLGRCGLPGLGPRSIALDVTPVVDVDQGSVAAAWWRLGTAACALGTAGGALARARSYVETRHQFGAPLVQIPTIARTVRTIGRELDDASTAILTEAGRAGDIPPDLARSVANTAVRGCLESVQLLGGYGYLTEYIVEGRLRDAVSLRAISRLAPS